MSNYTDEGITRRTMPMVSKELGAACISVKYQ